MRTVSDLLHEARVRRKMTLGDLARETRIKKNFLVALEKSDWGNLPEFPVVTGFVKSVAEALGVERDTAVATLRRDYPPKKLAVNPKKDVQSEFNWNPRRTFWLAVTALVLVVLGYLGATYVRFARPPKLELTQPIEGTVISGEKIEVRGKTDPEVTVRVNNELILVDEKGEFVGEVDFSETIVVEAVSRYGKKTTIERKITKK